MGDVGQQVEALRRPRGRSARRGDDVVAAGAPFQQETVEFKLAPRECDRIQVPPRQGRSAAVLVEGHGPVNYEFHAEPDGAPRGYAQTYEKKRARDRSLRNADRAVFGHPWLVLGEHRPIRTSPSRCRPRATTTCRTSSATDNPRRTRRSSASRVTHRQLDRTNSTTDSPPANLYKVALLDVSSVARPRSLFSNTGARP